MENLTSNFDANNMDDLDTDEVVGDASTLFVKDVAKIDCAVFDPSQGIIGQSWYVDISLSGHLDANGFVYDFSPLKQLLRQVLATSFDHTMIIPIGSQAVQFEEFDGNEQWKLRSRSRAGKETCWTYLCPKGAVFPIRCVALKTGIIEQEFSRLMRHRLPASVQSLSIRLREESIAPTEAAYRYTHGIKGHAGLCQRLFHGHRSRIEIFIGEERRPDLEHFIAREVLGTNIHIASPDQIKDADMEIGKRGTSDELVTLSFTGSLGNYEGKLPANRIFVVEQETSVECIARELARIIKREEKPSDRVRVVCYEGIDKGSVAECT